MKENLKIWKRIVDRFVARPAEFERRFDLAGRLTALCLISALLMPLIYLRGEKKAAAQTRLPVQNLSAPPEPFVTSSSGSISVKAFSSVSALNTSPASSYNFIVDSFSTPEMPEGFAMAKPVSPASAFLSSVGNSFASVFSFFTANASPAAPFGQPAGAVNFDFDNDGKADIGRRRPSNNEWQIKNSSNGSLTTTTISASGNIAPADYDGDNKTDMAIFTASTGTWTIKRSSDGQTTTVSGFGQTGDVPVSGNYTGDGKADLAVFRPSNSTWYFREVGNTTVSSYQFGASGDIVVPGNYDNDSFIDYAVFRPSTGYWYVTGSSAGFMSFQWGLGTDIPVPADYDNDGKTDYAVYRGSTGTWYAYKSSGTGQYITQVWGNYGDQPAPADYDNDGKADFAVWRPTTGVWHILKSSNSAYEYQTLGAKGDTAVSAAYLKQIGAEVFSYDFMKARLSPKNATGGTNLYSQNFSWGTSLVSLPGRAGLDAGLGISYNSLVWTKYIDASNNNQTMMVFDADTSNVSPGFRFGFPVIEPAYYNNSTGFAYLMVMPSGERVEFRQTASIDTYETADSSYSQLKINGAGSPLDPIENITITVFYMGGTQMTYQWKAGAYRCSKIMDRNGNYIDITHNDQGLLTKVKDTLEREINVNYDTQLYPTSITQTWKDNNGAGSNVTHTWATFNYGQISVNPSFDSNSISTIYGPSGSAPVKALTSIVYPNGNSVYFYYNDYGQVWKIRNIAADSLSHELNAVRTDLETPSSGQTDCPRFTKTYNKIENFNGGNEFLAAENTAPVSASFTPPGGSQQTGTLIEIKRPDGAGNADKLRTKIYSASSGWAEGLPVLTEDWADEGSGLVKKRWTWTKWAQDDMTVTNGQPFPYILNPRVEETKVGDPTNTRRTTIEYYLNGQTTVSYYGVVKEIIVYDTDQTTILKKEVPEYLGGDAYLSRRLIGLLSKRILYARDENNSLTFASVQEFGYDEEDFTYEANQNISNVVQHDNTNYSSSFVVGRGNLTSVKRLDVTGQTSPVTTKIRYDIAGSVVAQITPWTSSTTRTVRISYADTFNDGINNRNTYAYPTKIYDPADNYSEVKYRFDIGTNVWAKSPTPQGPTGSPNSKGKETERIFDSIGRLQKEKIVNYGGTYTRYEYPYNTIQTKVYTTVTDTNNNDADSADEVLSEIWTDGAGRVRRSRTEHPGSTGGWSATQVEYDILGRVTRSTVPTEVSVNETTNVWTPAGDDNRGLDTNSNPIWLWQSQEYDWKDRITKQINTDGTFKSISYQGCGCAGGQVTTIEDEEIIETDWQGQNPTSLGRRTKKIYEDILGRSYKMEILNWNNSIYATTVRTFNGRDQVTLSRHYAGTTSSSTYQDTTFSYDGHGRLKTQHLPQQDANTATTYNYNADDSTQSAVDARGATTSYTYNSRGLVATISYAPPSNSQIPDTPDVSFDYDAAGNRIEMTDGLGTVDYTYTELSQLKTETRDFNQTHAPTGTNPKTSFQLKYEYALSGGLKSLEDPYGQKINYSYDKTGRLSSVTDPNSFGGVSTYASNPQYRAWGGLKSLNYGNNSVMQMQMSYNNRLQAASYQLTGANQQTIMQKTYSYLADGSLRKLDDTVNDLFDRMMSYDHAGRIEEGKSAAEARGGTVAAQDRSTQLPYYQTYQFNAFDNMTERNNMHWGVENWYGQANNLSYTYQNNRVTNNSWTYDADGRATGSFDGQWVVSTYDAKGQLTWFDRGGEKQYERFYGGDNREWKRKEKTFDGSNWVDEPTKYYIRSSVLGGETVSEADSSGRKVKTYVRAAGATLAWQTVYHGSNPAQEYVNFEHLDASGLSYHSTMPNGNAIYGEGGEGSPAELDPMGGNVGLSTPYIEPEPEPMPPFDPEYPSLQAFGFEDQMVVNGQRVSCTLDGMTIGCGQAQSMLQSGSAIQAPVNQVVAIWSNSQNRYVGLAVWNQQAAQNGLAFLGANSLGFIPVGVTYRQGVGLSGTNVYQWFGGWSGPPDQSPNFISQTSAQLYSMIQGMGLEGANYGLRQPNMVTNRFGTFPDTPSNEEMRDRLSERQDRDGGKCRQFLNSVLKNLGIKKSIEDIFDEFTKNGGEVVIAININTAGVSHYDRDRNGNKIKGNKNIGVSPMTHIERYTNVVIHELFHRATGDGAHRSMARNAYTALSAADQNLFPLPTKRAPGLTMDETYSNYFSRLMNEFCRPPI